MKSALGLALIVGLACSVSSSQNRGVTIPGESPEAQLALAQRVIGSVSAAGLAAGVHKAVPEAPEELLAGLSLRATRMAGVSSEGAFDQVSVQCSLTASLSDPVATRVVEACKAVVEQHLEQLLVRGSAA